MIDPRAQELYDALARLVGALTASRGEIEGTHGFTSRCTPDHLVAAAEGALAAAARAGYGAPDDDDGAFTRAEAEALVGRRIMTTRPRPGVPAGTTGTVSAATPRGNRGGYSIGITWERPHRPHRHRPLTARMTRDEWNQSIIELAEPRQAAWGHGQAARDGRGREHVAAYQRAGQADGAIGGRKPMLTIEDCIALSDLTEEEIDAVAEHEHIPEMLAVELGSYLVHLPDGERRIRRIIADDIRAARERGDLAHVAKLKLVLRHFLEHHAAQAVPRPKAAR